MRIRNNPNAKNELLSETRFIENKERLQEILSSKENKSKKIYLEIGMGKGDFISNLASYDQDNIYIGVELSISVLAIALKKIRLYEKENNIKLDNLYFMSFDAINLEDYFKKGQVEKLYLNFSDPWPKKKHTKRRLTYKSFLEKYKSVLKEHGIIEFKTDNRSLFEFSLVSMQNFGMKFLEVYLDLHKTDIFNIVTEYESKFSKIGPIYKLVAEF
jgi:tRNA (guanine-N7-)-methyltransferase